NFEAVASSGSVNNTVVDDADTALISIIGPGTVIEGQVTTAYTVSISGGTPTSNVTVALTYSGTAVDGSDFTGVANVTIPANSSSSTFNLTTIDDVLVEGAENVTITLGAITGTGGFEAIAVNSSANSVTTSITDNDVPTLSVSNPTVVEGNIAVFTVSLNQVSPTNVVFTPSLSNSTATLGTDTAASSTLEVSTDGGGTWSTVVGNVTITAGDTSVQLRLATTDDRLAEGSEAFRLTATVTSGNTGNASAFGDATITDEAVPGAEDTALVSIAGPGTVIEGQTTTAYTVSINGAAPTSAVTVALTYSGTASNGSDFTGVANVTIPANSSSTTFTLATIDDRLAEGSENIIITLG
ncbi:MAG: Calx-beta domain-containing protein, partial [Pseudomonadota bacterium]